MAEWGAHPDRSKAGARVETFDARGRAAAAWLPRLNVLPGARETLERWLAAEVAPGRLMPWLPVAFGLGVVLYFTAEQEPAWWSGLSLAVGLALATFLARRRPVAARRSTRGS